MLLSAIDLVPLFRNASIIPDEYYELKRIYFDERMLEFSREEWDFLQGKRETKLAADTLIAECFLYGKKGFPPNPYYGHYLLQPITANYSPAQTLIGDCHWLGLGMEKNPAEAVEWYKKAAVSGNATAQLGLAKIYEDQATRDSANKTKWYEAAFRYLQSAAEKKLPEALYHLGRLHVLGLCKKANLEVGRTLVMQAADLGNPEAIEIRKEIESRKKEQARGGLTRDQLRLDETFSPVRTLVKINGTDH